MLRFNTTSMRSLCFHPSNLRLAQHYSSSVAFRGHKAAFLSHACCVEERGIFDALTNSFFHGERFICIFLCVRLSRQRRVLRKRNLRRPHKFVFSRGKIHLYLFVCSNHFLTPRIHLHTAYRRAMKITTMLQQLPAAFVIVMALTVSSSVHAAEDEITGHVSLGPRPFWLVNEMRSNSVKEKLGKEIANRFVDVLFASTCE